MNTTFQTRPLAGKSALVTGAASGIGRASAIALAQAGATVVVADIDDEGGSATVRQVTNDGDEACFVHADVSREEEVASLVAATVARYGHLDCAVNNAGISARGELTHELTAEVWSRVLALNLTGVWLCLKHEITQMLEQGGGGAIVNMASVAGLVGGTTSVYVASKHGVVGLTRQAALEYAPRGIRVNAVCPGVIQTPMVDRAFAARPGLEEQWRAAEPIGRLGAAEEVAAAVVWLCSDAASFVTGVALPVDGGWVAQ
ncbi:MAG: glucose 1-dehydrogenase [Thermomicrobiales bacterium]|nr:glucose 1-dehydrogenase [Thermomicrobiales bacterium]